MTEEQKARRKEYRREWRRKHPEKIREYYLTRLRNAALKEILAKRSAENTDNSPEEVSGDA